MVDSFLIGFSFSAGAAAFLNPCGFAMLPTYVSHYIGRKESGSGNVASGVFKGLGLGAISTLGFISVFALSGVLLSMLGTVLVRYVPWLTIIIGFILVIMGLTLISGRSIHFSQIHRLNINPVQKGSGSFFLFGVAYAIASLSCTIPLFLLVVFQAVSTGGFISGIVIFFSYALGMGVMMTILSVALGASKEVMTNYLKRIMPHINRIGSLIIILTGIYLIYYQIFVGRFLEGVM